MKIRAIASFCPQAILRAADRRGLQMIRVLYPVIHVFQRPVVDLSSGEDRICLAPDDGRGQRPDLVADDYVTGMLQVCEERGSFLGREWSRLRWIDCVPDLRACQPKLFPDCDRAFGRGVD